nr:MAG TPA: DNA pilot protein VP2 [Microviridae sp.]
MGLLDFIPVVGDVASAVGNAVSTNKTNKTNMAINQMNNEFNAAEAEKARQFQLDMWNKTNEYNSASAQRSRLEEAGLNPYLMMNGGSAGTAQSSGSSTPASAASPLSMQRQDFSGLSNTLSSALQIANQTKETNANVQTLQSQKSLYDAQANSILSNVDWWKLGPEYKKWSQMTGLARAGLQFQTDRQNLRNMTWSGNLIQAQRIGVLLDNKSKTVINKYLDEGQRLQLDLMASQYYDSMASGHLKYQQAKSEIAKRIVMAAEAKGLRINNNIAEETAEGYIKALNAEYAASYDINSPFTEGKNSYVPASVLKSRMDALQSKWQFDKRYWSEGLNALGTIGNAVGSVGNLRKPGARNTYVYGNKTYNRY